MRFLGYGQSRHHLDKLLPGEQPVEVGNKTFAVTEDFWCDVCEGCGCRECKFTGEMETRKLVREKRREQSRIRRENKNS